VTVRAYGLLSQLFSWGSVFEPAKPAALMWLLIGLVLARLCFREFLRKDQVA